MGQHSDIQWTDHTWPIVQGCDPVSQGCVHCYAIRELWRMMHHPDRKISGPLQGLTEKHRNRDGEEILRFTGKVALREDRLTWPLAWKKPSMIFVPSHGDLFHKDVPDIFIDKVFAVMALCPQHQLQVLTKRSERMRDYVSADDVALRIANAVVVLCQELGIDVPAILEGDEDQLVGLLRWPLQNIWLGVSAEDQANADARIPHLLATPAAIRFVSLEPLLGPIDLSAIARTRAEGFMRPLDGRFNTLDWVIDGGESGSEPRDYDIDASRAIEAQCVAAGVPFFRKQLGRRPFERELSLGWGLHISTHIDDPGGPVGETRELRRYLTGFKHKKAGDPAEWPADLRRREFPRIVSPEGAAP